MKKPVVLIIFKRPDTTKKVFEAIRQWKPKKLFVIADAARTDRPGEAEKCEATRAVVEQVDWDCEVRANYSDVNLGCAKRISSGLNWVFEQVDEAIILEDDCVPHPTFFPFCEELLDKYKYDNRIASISGQNVQFGRKRTDYSYYFSRYNHCWGWATWKRAWQDFDIYMKNWPEIQKENFLNDILLDRKAVSYWQNRLQHVYDNPLNTVWSYQWTFASWIQNRLGIISNVNLISNIGFNTDSTNINFKQKSPHDNMPTEPLEFPLKHPPFVFRDTKADDFTQRTLFNETQWQIFKHKIKKMLKAYQY